MKKVLCAAALLLAMASFASAGVFYGTPVVDTCCPAPVYTYPAPTVYVEQMPVVVDGMVSPVYPTTVVPTTVVPSAGVYPYPSYIITPTYVVPRMPIRRMGVNRIW